LSLMIETKEGIASLNINLEDDILAGSLAIYNGQLRTQKK